MLYTLQSLYYFLLRFSLPSSLQFSPHSDMMFPSNIQGLVPKLDSSNYTAWRTKMEMVIIWSIVSKRNLRLDGGNDARTLEWDKEAKGAAATIILCLSKLK